LTDITLDPKSGWWRATTRGAGASSSDARGAFQQENLYV
jgi:hypothetical protein